MGNVWPYIFSVGLTKGLSFLVIPVATRQLTTDDYGRLEVVASLLEFTGLVLSLGLAETLFRFAGAKGTLARKREVAAELVGAGLVMAGVLGVLIQLAAPLIHAFMPVGIGSVALRCGLFAATLSGLVELPLAWMRFRDRPKRFAVFTGASGVLQAGLMVALLLYGFGAEGVIMGNAAVHTIFATLLIVLQIRETGVCMRTEAFVRAGRYGLPIVAAGLAMFGLGACDRWFLVASVSPTEIAHYALAGKLGLSAALAVQPFGLWWYARRLDLLEQPDGFERSARAVGLGVLALALACTAACLVVPIFIVAALPSAYAPAIRYVPFVVLAVAMNELCSLTNVGCYRRDHGALVMMVNAAGAATALLSYVILIPIYGVMGALAATFAGQAVRLVLFQVFGYAAAPLPYPAGRLAIVAGLAVAAVLIAPAPSDIILRLAWSVAAGAGLIGAAWALSIWELPERRQQFA